MCHMTHTELPDNMQKFVEDTANPFKRAYRRISFCSIRKLFDESRRIL